MKKVSFLLIVLSCSLVLQVKGYQKHEVVYFDHDPFKQNLQQFLVDAFPISESYLAIILPESHDMVDAGNGDIINDISLLVTNSSNSFKYGSISNNIPPDGVTRLLVSISLDTFMKGPDRQGNIVPYLTPITFTMTSMQDGSLSTLDNQGQRSLSVTVAPRRYLGKDYIYAVFNAPDGKDPMFSSRCIKINARTMRPPDEPPFGLDADVYMRLAVTSRCGPEGCLDNLPDGQGFSWLDPQTENVKRPVRDLVLWGSVGEEPLNWTRFWNSESGIYWAGYAPNYVRNFGSDNWAGSYQYDMTHISVPRDSASRVLIHYPEGEQNFFIETKKGSGIWKPEYAGTNKQLFQNGDSLILQRANGFRYRFLRLKKAKPPGRDSIYYLLQDFQDAHKNVYSLKYNKDNRLTRISDAAENYFDITDTIIEQQIYISKVNTSDNRSVHYNYKNGLLASVDYDDGTHATYATRSINQGSSTRIDTIYFVDTRYQGALTHLKVIRKYSYDLGGCFGATLNRLSAIKDGSIKLKNALTDEILVSLDTASSNKTLTYTNGRKLVYDMPASQQGQVKVYTDGLRQKREHEYNDGGIGFLKSTSYLQSSDLPKRTISFKTSKYGNPEQITYPDGSTESWIRDPESDLVKTHTNQLGQVTTYNRNSRNLVESIVYFDNSTETFKYNQFGQPTEHKRRNGGIEVSEYNARGLLVKFTDAGTPTGNTTSYTYDEYDRLATVKDARQNTTGYQYNKRGQLTIITHPGGSYQEYGYDTLGNQVSFKNELQKEWKTEYDEYRRVKKTTNPLPHSTEYSYRLPDDVCEDLLVESKPKEIRLPSGRKTTMEYDHEFNLTLKSVGAGTSDEANTKYNYDLVGNNTVTIVLPSSVSVMDYDAMGRVTMEADPLGNITTNWYDAIGRIDSVQRADKGKFRYTYRDAVHKVNILNPERVATIQEYDVEGNLLSVLDTKANLTQYQYNFLNQLEKKIYPVVTQFEQYTYDAVGNLKTFRNRAAKTKTYNYDTRNRVQDAAWDDVKTPAVNYTYDNAGRVTSVSNANSSIGYGYNIGNELTSDTQRIAGSLTARTVVYTYNQDGLLLTLTYPNGEVKTYSYTERNQPKAIVDNGLIAFYTYDPYGNVQTKELKNTTLAKFGYDLANQVKSIEHLKGDQSFFTNRSARFAGNAAAAAACVARVTRFDYGYDQVGRNTFVQRDRYKGDVFGYNANDQLTSVKYEVLNPDGTPGRPDSTVNYDLDSAGNRRSVTETVYTDSTTITRVINYQTNSLNQYTSIVELPPTITPRVNSVSDEPSIEYTDNGNLEKWDGWTYEYDAEDRLLSATKASKIFTFEYDALGRRVIDHYEDGQKTNFNLLYYDNQNLIEERKVTGELLASYVYGATNELLTMTRGTLTLYYHHDGQGNVVRLTDDKGIVVEEYHYETPGAPIIYLTEHKDLGSRNFSGYGNRFMVGGREYFSELELFDFGGRMFSSNHYLGRFLQPDLDDLNPYGLQNTSQSSNGEGNGSTDWWGVGGAVLGIVGNTTAAVGSGLFAAGTSVSGVGAAVGIAGVGYFGYGIGANITNLADSWNGRPSSSTGALLGDIAQRFAPENQTLKWIALGGDVAAGIFGPSMIRLAAAAKMTTGNEAVTKVQTAGRFLFKSWHQGTFPNKLQSILYHVAKHGKGRTALKYTEEAMDFYLKNKNLGVSVLLKDGTQGLKIQTKILVNSKTVKVGGYWTKDGRLVTYWD